MKKLLSTLKAIFEVCVLLFDFVVNLVKGTIDLLQMIPEAVKMLTNSLVYLPAPFLAFGAASITIMVVYIVIGRSHSE